MCKGSVFVGMDLFAVQGEFNHVMRGAVKGNDAFMLHKLQCVSDTYCRALNEVSRLKVYIKQNGSHYESNACHFKDTSESDVACIEGFH